MKKTLFYLFAFAVIINAAIAQKKTKISIEVAADLAANVAVVYYDVKYVPTPGISLFDTQYESVIFADSETDKDIKTEISIKSPQILYVSIVPKKKSSNTRYMRHLFVAPGDDLKVKVDAELNYSYEGQTADYQYFLQDYFFTEQPWNNLPRLGYLPNKSDNWEVVQKTDSLLKTRKNSYEALKSKIGSVNPAYDAYVQAMMMTEPYLLRGAMLAKQMRQNTASKLSVEESEKIRKLCLDNFKILPDEALLNQTYRQELKNYVMYQVTTAAADTGRKYMSGANVRKAFLKSADILDQNHLKQREYLQTHWLDYAAGTLNDAPLAKELFEEYKIRYAASTLNEYFEQSIKTRLSLAINENAPPFTLKNKDNQDITLNNFQGKPTLLVFCYAVKQHEAILKIIEDKQAQNLNFVYINVTPFTPFEAWAATVTPRTGVTHLWASDEDAEKLKNKYLASVAYPFVLVGADGKLIKRWIPQEFPLNKTLQTDVKTLFP
jgi:AhpC/TSA family